MPTSLNSRIYPTYLPQLEKIHETSPSARDEAQFPCIACSAIPCSQYNTKGALICLIELQRVRKNNLRSREWHWCHQRNVKLFGVTQVNLRWRPTLLFGSSAIPHSPSYKRGGLSYFRQLQIFHDIPVSNLEEHQFQHRNSKKLDGCHIISRRERVPRILLKK